VEWILRGIRADFFMETRRWPLDRPKHVVNSRNPPIANKTLVVFRLLSTLKLYILEIHNGDVSPQNKEITNLKFSGVKL
jgi:hypothetical protein